MNEIEKTILKDLQVIMRHLINGDKESMNKLIEMSVENTKLLNSENENKERRQIDDLPEVMDVLEEKQEK